MVLRDTEYKPEWIARSEDLMLSRACGFTSGLRPERTATTHWRLPSKTARHAERNMQFVSTAINTSCRDDLNKQGRGHRGVLGELQDQQTVSVPTPYPQLPGSRPSIAATSLAGIAGEKR